ncbi:hypothetical protein FKP32DRAFT_1586468 [Trametes sanguinea]|nr:hypothetical protein FKP32DRAFT_1596401 [Trametes sanguinea]KAI9060331.1 hypothetical protein FKP32DRAFT_1595719 [Trametes sanguinea]KAI9064786.1 hypothetical protein FKP32DRAFT_1591160 [Trametes sanguinea]KAI9066630.1 hypothetical protein FKP32DRAFT_1589504 [Trametes sanguinea]KAI9068036.1 hypothetical protein FKP32DRAFT_1588064 [Trametes sanguinea]
MTDYASVQACASPAFASYIPLALLPYFAFLLLGAAFALAFYLSTLPNEKISARELAVASTASLLGGFGVVAMFCTVGVYV